MATETPPPTVVMETCGWARYEGLSDKDMVLNRLPVCGRPATRRIAFPDHLFPQAYAALCDTHAAELEREGTVSR